MTIFLYFQLNTLNSFAQSAGSGLKRSSPDTSGEAVSVNKRAKMFEDDNYLFVYLDKTIEEARKDILAGKGLTEKGAMAMLLKGMYNHMAHLEEKLVTKDEFKKEIVLIGKEFESLQSQFKLKFDLLQSQFEFLKMAYYLWFCISCCVTNNFDFC